ncbi:DUF7341 domain-containing protein [Microbacterium gilvum]|uniref:DUF7341 domain-containing protein n=1 Tax=Microbacterium gilvum TaxID=1336204 RepID=A0ABP9A7C5_9MICO
MTDELLDAVDDLTAPKPVKVDTDDGPKWATEDALLVQLAEAVSSSMNSGSGAGGAAWTRNVLDSTALYQATIITSTIGDWCRMGRVNVTRNPVTDLRTWYVSRLAAPPQTRDSDGFYIDQMKAWAGQIRSMINPPKTIEITAPCPVCNQGTYTNDIGELVTNPLVLIYRPDDEGHAKVMCKACDAIWNGKDAMEELNDELNDKTA